MSKWNLGEDPPDTERTVLMYLGGPGAVFTGFHQRKVWNYTAGHKVGSPVTHWRELPPEPDSEENLGRA